MSSGRMLQVHSNLSWIENIRRRCRAGTLNVGALQSWYSQYRPVQALCPGGKKGALDVIKVTLYEKYMLALRKLYLLSQRDITFSI